MCSCTIVQIKGKDYCLPSLLPKRGWQAGYSKSYLKYCSRATSSGIPRGEYAHRAVLRKLGADVAGLHVHHQDGNSRNNCPLNLVLMPAAFNPSHERRHPYTGRFLSRDEYERLVEKGVIASDIPF